MSNYYEEIFVEDQVLQKFKTTFPSGEEVEWVEVNTTTDFLDDDERNIRMGGEFLSTEEHRKRLLDESPKEFVNLKKSLSAIPQSSEALICFLNDGMEKPKKIHGHRRALGLEQIGKKEVRALVALNLSEDSRKFLRDNPEANPTKVNHSPFAKARMAYNELKGVTDTKERGTLINKISKRTGYSRAKVLQLEGTSAFMNDLCDEFGVDAEERKSQFKAFETCYKINKSDLQDLRIKGDFDRFEKVEDLMKGYLKLGVAHDDINTTLSYLAKAKPTDSLVTQMMDDEFDSSNIEDLRKLTVNVRLAQIKADSPVKEIKKACDREWQRTFELQEKQVASDIVDELKLVIQKFETLRDSMA